MGIEEEIQQRSFKSEYHKLNINILFTSAWLNQLTTQYLKPYNISWQQFNILRILRGRHPEPATIKILAERMIDKMSNASRLVEKLRQKGYVKRNECPNDRRRVDIVITDLGMRTVAKASEELEAAMLEQMSSITETEAALVNGILDRIRD